MRLSRLKQLMYEQIDKEFPKIVNEVEAALKAACPVESGELRSSITRIKRGKRTVIVGSKLKQMYYSNWGNGGKPIVPKKGEFMWFKSNKEYNLPTSKSGYYYAKHINPYEGKHWIDEVARRFNCEVVGGKRG